MFCLGVDQSLTGCGVALIDFKKGNSKIQAIDTIRSKKLGAERLIEIKKSLAAYLEDTLLSCVSRENYAFAAKGRSTFSMGELGGVINVMMHEKSFIQGKNYYIIHSTSWRKFLLGHGLMHKDTNYLMTMYKKFNIEFKDDNQADAFCLALMAGYIYSIKTKEMNFSDLTNDQQICLLDSDRLKKDKNLTQIKAVKELTEDEKRSYMLSF